MMHQFPELSLEQQVSYLASQIEQMAYTLDLCVNALQAISEHLGVKRQVIDALASVEADRRRRSATDPAPSPDTDAE